MCLQGGKSDAEIADIASFSKWVLDVGDGRLPTVNTGRSSNDPQVTIPSKFLIPSRGGTI